MKMKKIIILCLVLISCGFVAYKAISATKDPYYHDWLKDSKNLLIYCREGKRSVSLHISTII